MTNENHNQDIVERTLRSRANRREIMRRAAALGLSASAVGALTARGAVAQGTPAASAAPGGNEPKGPKADKLTFSTRASPEDAGNPNFYNQMEERAKAYTAAIGTEIELVTVPDADFRNRLSIAGPGGEGPDAFGPVAHDWLGDFAIQEIALPIPDGTLENPEDFIPVSIDLASVGGPLYGIPIFAESVALIYNKDMVPNPPTTWEELVTTATELTSGDVYGFGFPLLEQYHEGPFFLGFGSYIFPYENGVFNTDDIGLDNPSGVQAATFLRDAYNEQQPPMPDAVIDRTNMHGVIEGMMESSQLAMTINGPWRENPLQQAGINYGVAILPSLPTGDPMVPFVGIQANVVSAFSKNQEAALDFISFMSGTDSVVEFFKSQQKVPARVSAQQSEVVSQNENQAVWTEQLDYGKPMPNVAAMGEVWTPWGAAMDAIIPPNASDEETQQYLSDAVEQIRQAIERTK